MHEIRWTAGAHAPGKPASQKPHSRLSRLLGIVLVSVLVFVSLCGCGEGSIEVPQSVTDKAGSLIDQATSAISGDSAPSGEPYVAPDMVLTQFNNDAAEGPADARIDVSNTFFGYVSACATSDKRLKFQVIKGDDTYTYDLNGWGIPASFPLSCGDGEYRFRIMENVVDSKYAEKYSTTASVGMISEFAPFMVPSQYVPYTADSECVKKAAELAETAGTPLGEITAVYNYICKKIKYDREKAATVQSGYLPDPDETLRSGKGICFDYASLAACMLRSQGIPTKMVFGYVSPDDLYHAWNMIYTEETGWITVKFEVKGNVWTRMDLTFSANGSDAEFIGDGSNYADVYYY